MLLAYDNAAQVVRDRLKRGDAIAEVPEGHREGAGEEVGEEVENSGPEVEGRDLDLGVGVGLGCREYWVDIARLDIEQLEEQGLRLEAVNRSGSARSFSSCVSIM